MTNTTAELAASLDTTPRTLRKFLRSSESGIESVGKGSRYALPSSKREVNALAKRFAKWGEAQEIARAARAEAMTATDDAPADADMIDDDDTDREPTDDELAELDD